MGISIVAGRGFSESDMVGDTPVVIVNRAFERRFLKSGYEPGTVIVQRAEPAAAPQSMEVIGVAEDSAYLSTKDAYPPTIYTALTQANYPSRMPLEIAVRAAGGVSPGRIGRTIADAIARVEPTATFSFRTLADQVGAQYAQERLIAGLSLFLGAFALLQVAIGVYAVLVSTVTRRQFEVAIRVAVGATPVRVMSSLFSRAVFWSVLGGGIGVTLTVFASRLVEALVFQLDPASGLFRLESVGILLLATVLGAALPAFRAVRINPATLLR